jgi:hypothetical protein
MALRAEFSLLSSEFNAFLFAPIGEERNGMPLSVVSAFTRLELDPWQEAARLAALPAPLAAAALAPLIARLPDGRWGLTEAASIALHLVRLLPAHNAAPQPDLAPLDSWQALRRRARLWLFALALGALFFGYWATHGSQGVGEPAADAPVAVTSPADGGNGAES